MPFVQSRGLFVHCTVHKSPYFFRFLTKVNAYKILKVDKVCIFLVIVRFSNINYIYYIAYTIAYMSSL